MGVHLAAGAPHRVSVRASPLQPPLHRFAAAERDDDLVAEGQGGGRRPRLALERHRPLVQGQPVEVGAVGRRERLEVVEAPRLLERLGVPAGGAARRVERIAQTNSARIARPNRARRTARARSAPKTRRRSRTRSPSVRPRAAPSRCRGRGGRTRCGCRRAAPAGPPRASESAGSTGAA